jgi:hypothetical protein
LPTLSVVGISLKALAYRSMFSLEKRAELIVQFPVSTQW